MEFRRTLIMVALATVTYFMFLTWQQDYGNKPAEESTPIVAEAEAVVDSSLSVIPDVAETNAELPVATVSAIPEVITSVPAAVEQTTSINQLIRVKTDVFEINIDPIGGDIVRVALKQYTRAVGDETPFVLMDRTHQLNYVAQSGLVKAVVPGLSNVLSGLDDHAQGRPVYKANAATFELVEGQDSLDVVLITQTPEGIEVHKTYRFHRGQYQFDVIQAIHNNSSMAWTGVPFGQIKRDNSKDPSSDNHSFGMITFLGGAWWTPEKSYNKLSLSDFAKKGERVTVDGGWAAMVQHYFVSAWVPDSNTRNTISTRTNEATGENFIGFTGSPLVVEAGKVGTINSQFYAGPKLQDRLEALSPGLELTVDYGWLWPIAQFLFWVLKTLNGFIGNWGWSIIALTVLVKAAFFHLSATSYRSMANMRRVMPEMQRMKEKFGDDRAKLSQAMMELYKKEKINPLGGCLPILVQMPVFIALYWTLMESVELRHAGWLLWIKDLSLMDPYFVLPLLMGVSMYLQQMLNPTPIDPMQAKVMKFMPIVFTIFFLWFPAGLVLYWLVNNVLSIAQQWIITRQIEKSAAKAEIAK